MTDSDSAKPSNPLRPYSSGGLGVTAGNDASERGARRAEINVEAQFKEVVKYFLEHPGLYITPNILNAILNSPVALARRGGQTIWVQRRMSDMKNWGALAPELGGQHAKSASGEPLGLTPDWEMRLKARKSDEFKKKWSLLRKVLKPLQRSRQIEIVESAIAEGEATCGSGQ